MPSPTPLLLGLLLALGLALLLPVQALWPAPRHILQGADPVLLSPTFTIAPAPALARHTLPSDLHAAINRTLTHILSHSHRQLLTPHNAAALHRSLQTHNLTVLHRLELSWPQSKTAAAWLLVDSLKAWSWKNIGVKIGDPFGHYNISIESISSEIRKPLLERDESYQLSIERDVHNCRASIASLSASNALGLLRGLQTFSQLVHVSDTALPAGTTSSLERNSSGPDRDSDDVQDENQDEKTEEKVFRYLYGPLTINDAPAFPYRGLLLDTSRNFYPLSDLKRTIEAMSWAKLSTFHWHITDAQSWPLHLPIHPELTARGAYGAEQVYGIEEVRELVEYANERGVDVMLEIDTPGHTSVIAEVYPQFVACRNAQPWSRYAAEPPAGQLRIADDDVLRFVEDIYKFVGQEIPGSLFSSGGDEVNHKCYEEDEQTQTSLTNKNQTFNEALYNFIIKTHHQIRQNGNKIPVVWEELILDESLNLEKDTIIAVWKNSNHVRDVVNKGYRIIHAASDFAYLDCGLGGWLGKSAEGNSWCDPFKTWQKIYSFDPFANIDISQRKLVTGGQVLLWSEQADPQNLDSLIWPRALAAAEVYWTGHHDSNVTLNQRLAEALPRLHDMRYRMVERGIQATALQPHWCALRPGECDMP